MSESFTNTRETRSEFVRRVNSGAGEVWSVQGREVHARFGELATEWQNGSVSVQVRGRGKRTQGTVWVKEGETVSFN